MVILLYKINKVFLVVSEKQSQSSTSMKQRAGELRLGAMVGHLSVLINFT